MARILVVDDEQPIRTILRKLFTLWNHETVEAVDGQQALEVCREQVPDLVLLDLYMPRMNGLEFLSAARAEFPNLPVVAMTGQSPSASLVPLAAAKCFGSSILRKPFDIRQVSIHVCDALGEEWNAEMVTSV